MGGLLDKANAKKNETEDTKEVKAKVSKAEEVTVKVDKTAPQTKVASSPPPKQNPELAMKLNIAGWVAIVVGGILALQGGGMGILVVLGVLLVGIGLIVQSERLAEGDMNVVKLGLSIFVAVIVAAGPYAALVLVPADSSMALTEIALNEDSDEVTFSVRGSFDSATATISLDGETVWSDTMTLSNDRAKFKAPLSAFFDGNSQDYRLASMKSYLIDVTSDDDQTASSEITPSLMNREILNSGARISEVLKTETSGTTTTTSVDGLIVESIMGMFAPGEGPQDNGEHSMTNLGLTPVSSDYTMQLRIKKSGSTEYNSPIISVDGLDATWTSSVSGSKSGKTNGWLGLPGTATDSLNTEYIQKDSFYDGAGCYTFEIFITNDYYAGMTDSESSATGIMVSSNSWELDFNADSNQRTMEVC
tara:strand:+ start:2514 stop:3770 length:1257 start_codon:yes stop_codon:yes gene_type:complete